MQRAPTFEAIYAEHATEVHRAALAILRDATLAEDVVQDVFERVWRGSGHDERRGPLGPYLRLLARSRALDLWRRTRSAERAQHRLEEQAELLDSRPEPGGRCSPAPPSAGSHARRSGACRTSSARPSGSPTGAGCRRGSWPRSRSIPLGTAKSRVRLGLDRLSRDPELVAA